MSAIYDNPWVYELACSFRDVPTEVDIILGWCTRHGTRPGSVLELAAGPAEHAREFARQGITVAALDLNPAMCAYARRRAAEANIALDVIEADMTAFQLDRRFDLIVTMLDSTSHLPTLEQFVAYLDRAADHLAEGGLKIIEMSHPADRLTDRPSVSSAWRVERDGVTATVRWGEPSDSLDPITQIVEEHVSIVVDRGDMIQGVVPYRFWTATELDAVIRLSGRFDVVAQYGDFGDVPLDSPEAWRMITVLRARGSR